MRLPLGGLLVAVTTITIGAAGAAGEGRNVETGEASRQIERETAYQYALALPEGYDEDEQKRWPMIMDLHGSGVLGLDTLKRQAASRDGRFIWLLPRHDGRGWWDTDTLAKMIEQVKADHRVDPDRICVMGYSMGGFGTWSFASEYPHLVAAAAPIAGGGNPFLARRMVHVPVWAFHGKLDDNVEPELAEVMVEALERAGGQAKLTVYPDVGHGCNDLVHSNGALYEWFLAQRRATRARDEWVSRSGKITPLTKAPTIDGKVEGKGAWQAAARLTGFMRPLGAHPAEVQTEVQIGYTETHLYVALTAWDPAISDLKAERTERDAEVWFDDSVEVLIDPNRDQKTYYQFVVNANGAIYDGKGFDGQWDAEGVEVATSKREDRWSAELAIPWEALEREAPKAGETMGMLFARTHADPGRPRYYTQWPPTNGKGNHAVKRFAEMTVAGSDE